MRLLKRITVPLLLIGIATALVALSPTERYFEIAKNMKIFAKLYQEVNKYYVDEVNPTELMNAGINAMLSTLDPYTNFIPEDEIENYRTQTTGEYGGIGVQIINHQGKVIVTMPTEGYIAHKLGLEIGDEILEIDGIDLSNRTPEEISKLLKGQAGSIVRIKIKRFGIANPISLELKRERIQINNVRYFGMVTKDIGFIQLSEFTKDAHVEVRKALQELKSQGAQKIILDLRGNPGGLLSEAISVSNLFLNRGLDIVSTKGKIEEWNKVHKSQEMPEDAEIPLVVLINEASASAAEIVSGVMQDYDRGVIIGKRSFGKGLVQATRPLEFNSQLKVTIAKYYIPSGRCIQEIDYSKKDENGNTLKKPDSLRTAFKTKNGRIVYDGGGISPDIQTEKIQLATITQTLLQKGLIFDYATYYKFKHKEVTDPKSFALSDQEYKNFIDWLKDKDYQYKTNVEKSLEKLIEAAKTDKYYDNIQAEISQLSQKINISKENDLIKFKNEIREILETEILSRNYLKKRLVESTFDNDEDIIKAIQVLNNQDEYDKILRKK
ncbi:MAG: S41 family peptidase [Flammeovirgaceae bacterium]|nr:S41 family peptidase [Flammeovirgaceae bacterium]